MTKLAAEIVVALAEESMNVAAVARRFYRNRNTIMHHIEKVQEETGLNPLNFYDLNRLLPTVKVIANMEGKK